jgi:hypothetical protein
MKRSKEDQDEAIEELTKEVEKKGGKVVKIAFDKNETVEQRVDTLTNIVTSFDGMAPLQKNAKLEDKKTFEITRADALGIAHAMLRYDKLVCDFGLMMDFTAFALNRNVWNFEFATNGVGVEVEKKWNDVHAYVEQRWNDYIKKLREEERKKKEE